jgi:aspartyl-tRNA(Asn)/glutamyl-tRNA(Gln) amidotransferase subunit A
MTPADLDLISAGTALRAGSLTSENLIGAVLDRIAQREPTLNAFTALYADRALAAARAADRDLMNGIDHGPLHGLPVGIKDLIDIDGEITGCGSRVAVAGPARADAEVVRRLRAKGAIILGKLQTYEFAVVGPDFNLPHPPARNPWNRDHITGGSSSGSAAAVAGGLLRTALGTDTGGSIRSPSSYCGAVGLKPTYGTVPTGGVFPLSPSLDVIGPLSASVAEAALTFDAIADTKASRLIGAPVAGLRVGYARAWFASDPNCDAAVLQALDDAASTLSLLGVRIEEIDLPDYALFEAAGAVVLHAEAYQVHKAMMAADPRGYGRLAYQSVMSGMLLSDADVAVAREAGAALTAELFAAMAPVDALLTANTLSTALPFSAFDGETVVWTHMRTLPFNVTGQPVLALPSGFSNRLPMGLQLAARPGDEALLCQIGHAFEQATDHSAQRPQLPGL